VSFSGNLVFAKSHLARILNAHASNPKSVHRAVSTDHDRGGEIATGAIGEILKSGGISTSVTGSPASLLPFALNGRPEDREEAELRLAQSIREESAHKDAPMARWVDRRISWRISYWLASHTRATPNMVTVANTMFGLATAFMFSVPNYWMRLFAAIFFLISITIDGVDGELARLKMVESDLAARWTSSPTISSTPPCSSACWSDATGSSIAAHTCTLFRSCWAASRCARTRRGVPSG
jgi:hypothetical protein